MKGSELGTQLLIAGATAAVTTTVAIFITNWFTKRSTTQDIASGKQPLPPGSTPTTNGPPVTAKPTGSPMPSPSPPPQVPPSLSDLANAMTIAQGINAIQGYMGPSWSNAQQCPEGFHWGGYDEDNPNLPKCIPN
jgi:hypothetical protein